MFLQNRQFLKFFKIFAGKHLRWSLFLIKLQVQTCNFIKKRLQHGCFSGEFVKFLRASFFTEQLRQLLTAVFYFTVNGTLLSVFLLDLKHRHRKKRRLERNKVISKTFQQLIKTPRRYAKHQVPYCFTTLLLYKLTHQTYTIPLKYG